jgi:two-component system, OmpR family, response regulator
MGAPILRTVLYVDDDPDICEVVQTTLCVIAGLEVYIAHSGREAIDRAYEFRPDLILMDVMMPGLDGPATLRQMRRHVLIGHIPVAFLTAKVLPAEIARFLEIGAIGVLEKPFDPAKLGSDLRDLWNGVRTPINSEISDTTKQRAVPPGELLATRFLDRAERNVAQIRDMLQRAANGDFSAFRNIELVAHSLHGSAAMFGFSKVSTLSGAIERLLESSATTAHGTPSEGWTPLLQQLSLNTEQLASEVATAASIKPSRMAMLQAGGRSR